MRLFKIIIILGLFAGFSPSVSAGFASKPFYRSPFELPSYSHLTVESLVDSAPDKRAFIFSSESSTMNLLSGTSFFINAAIFPIVGGTVTQEDGAEVHGGMVVVSNDGRFIHGIGSTSVGLFGNFTQLSNGVFSLGGNTRMSATFGPISGPVEVNGMNNRIEGSAYFQYPITLMDSSTTLTIAVNNVINQPIYLNGGTLILDSDLSFGYSGYLVGPGMVDGQGVGSLRFSGTADQWNTGLSFKNIHTLELSGSTKLTGTWNFYGETNIVGAGSLLDTRGLGIFHVTPNSVLKLNGVKLANVKQSTLCMTPTSTIYFSDSSLSTAQTMTFTVGTYIVASDSVFAIRSYDLSVTTSAQLIINASTLWLDAADTTGLSLFQADDSAFVKKRDGGLLRVLTDMDYVSDGASRRLLNGNVLGDITLSENLSLRVNQAISYGGSATLDGSGTSILFAKGSLGQLIVPPGISLTIRNLNLMRVSNGVLSIPSTANLNISNDVLIELDQDTVLSTGAFRMIGSTDILRIRGNGGRKKLTLAPADDNFIFNIRSNTLMLEDIELVGIEHIQYSFTTDNLENRIVGAIGLLGASVIDIRQDTNMSLLINGRDSGLVLVNNNLTLNGSVLFGLAPENVLNILFALQSGSDLPRVSFGDGFCTLTSIGGNAGINFLNDQVTLDLLREKSLIAGERSFLSGKNIIVTTNPIRIASTQFTLRQGTDLSPSGMTNPIDVITSRDPSLFLDLMGPIITSYHLKEFESIKIQAEAQYQRYLDDTVATRALETRSRILVPAPTVRVMGRLALSRGVGAVALTAGGSIHRFLPDNWVPFSASLTGGSKLEQKRVRPYAPIPLRDPASLQQASDGTFAGLKETDVLYVTKGQNIVAVNSDFNVLGEILIDEDAELIFDLSNGAVLTFGRYYEGVIPNWELGLPVGYRLSLPINSTIRFKGNGTVRFADGSEIICNGSSFNSTVSIQNPRLFNDDRPEVVIADHAQLSIADHHRLTIKGRGKFNITTNGELNVGDGLLTLGTSDNDFFDFNVSRQGVIRASVPRYQTSDRYQLEARCMVNNGFFNLNFTDRGALEIGDRGIVELGLNHNQSTRGFINKFTFASQAVLSVSSGGTLVFGQNLYAPAGADNLVIPIPWDNRSGEIYGGGIVRAVDGSVYGGRTLFEATLQRAFFETSDSSNYTLVRKLSKVTPQLLRAFDYKLANGNYYLELSSVTLLLNPFEILYSENPSTGIIFGTLSGADFRILPDGTRTSAG